MELKQEFWDEHGRDLVVDGAGNVTFTKPGRAKYTPLFDKWGYALTQIRNVAEFKRVLRKLNALEFEENNAKLVACLHDPQVPQAEKDFIRKLLGPAATGASTVAARPAGLCRSMGVRATGLVIEVDFRLRQRVSS